MVLEDELKKKAKKLQESRQKETDGSASNKRTIGAVAKAAATSEPVRQRFAKNDNKKWYKGDKPTETETLAQIVKTAKTDRAKAEEAYGSWKFSAALSI